MKASLQKNRIKYYKFKVLIVKILMAVMLVIAVSCASSKSEGEIENADVVAYVKFDMADVVFDQVVLSVISDSEKLLTLTPFMDEQNKPIWSSEPILVFPNVNYAFQAFAFVNGIQSALSNSVELYFTDKEELLSNEITLKLNINDIQDEENNPPVLSSFQFDKTILLNSSDYSNLSLFVEDSPLDYPILINLAIVDGFCNMPESSFTVNNPDENPIVVSIGVWFPTECLIGVWISDVKGNLRYITIRETFVMSDY